MLYVHGLSNDDNFSLPQTPYANLERRAYTVEGD